MENRLKHLGLIVFLFVLNGLLMLSCKKKSTEFDMGYDYFPQIQGHYVVYDVTQIITDLQVNQQDTSHYFLKAVIGDTFIDNSGRIAKEYVRYLGNSMNGPWTVKDVWTTIIDQGRGELVEENNRVVKLVFKPSSDDEWDMNVFNTLGKMECYYENIGDDYELNGQVFKKTVTVEQENFSSYIDDRRKFEVYAKGIGLIHKHFKDNTIEFGNPQNVKKGNELYMKAVAFGQ